MPQQVTRLEYFFRNRTENASTYNPVYQTKPTLHARVGETRESVHVFNAVDVMNVNRDRNHYRGVIGRTWALSDAQTSASF